MSQGRPSTCQRDEDGWRIPRPGTKSYRIYELAKQGKTTKEIVVITGFSPNSVAVLRHGLNFDAAFNLQPTIARLNREIARLRHELATRDKQIAVLLRNASTVVSNHAKTRISATVSGSNLVPFRVSQRVRPGS